MKFGGALDSSNTLKVNAWMWVEWIALGFILFGIYGPLCLMFVLLLAEIYGLCICITSVGLWALAS